MADNVAVANFAISKVLIGGCFTTLKGDIRFDVPGRTIGFLFEEFPTVIIPARHILAATSELAMLKAKIVVTKEHFERIVSLVKRNMIWEDRENQYKMGIDIWFIQRQPGINRLHEFLISINCQFYLEGSPSDLETDSKPFTKKPLQTQRGFLFKVRHVHPDQAGSSRLVKRFEKEAYCCDIITFDRSKPHYSERIQATCVFKSEHNALRAMRKLDGGKGPYGTPMKVIEMKEENEEHDDTAFISKCTIL